MPTSSATEACRPGIRSLAPNPIGGSLLAKRDAVAGQACAGCRRRDTQWQTYSPPATPTTPARPRISGAAGPRRSTLLAGLLHPLLRVVTREVAGSGPDGGAAELRWSRQSSPEAGWRLVAGSQVGLSC